MWQHGSPCVKSFRPVGLPKPSVTCMELYCSRARYKYRNRKVRDAPPFPHLEAARFLKLLPVWGAGLTEAAHVHAAVPVESPRGPPSRGGTVQSAHFRGGHMRAQYVHENDVDVVDVAQVVVGVDVDGGGRIVGAHAAQGASRGATDGGANKHCRINSSARAEKIATEQTVEAFH